MRRPVLGIAMAVALAACGGAATSPIPTAVPAPSRAATAAATATASTPAPAASLAVGSIKYRVVNLTSSAVDVYVRSQGLMVAAPAAVGVAAGSVSATLAPPEPGTVVVLKAGGTNPTCVSACGFLAESSTNAGEGTQRTLVVRSDGATEYWEIPKAASVGTVGNALRPADPTRPLLLVIAQAVTDAQFGLQLAYPGTAGCQKNVDASNLLIGGTNVAVFVPKAGGTSVTLHASTDKDCSGTPVGGPYAATVAAGARAYLFLSGSSGSMKGLVVQVP